MKFINNDILTDLFHVDTENIQFPFSSFLKVNHHSHIPQLPLLHKILEECHTLFHTRFFFVKFLNFFINGVAIIFKVFRCHLTTSGIAFLKLHKIIYKFYQMLIGVISEYNNSYCNIYRATNFTNKKRCNLLGYT